MSRREATPAMRIGVDAASFSRHHDYVTVVTDLDSDALLHVSDGKQMGSTGADLGAAMALCELGLHESFSAIPFFPNRPHVACSLARLRPPANSLARWLTRRRRRSS